MMISLTATTAATYVARTGAPTWRAVARLTTVATGPVVRERLVAPIAAKSQGHVRLDDDAIAFAGTSAWSPPT